MTKATFEMTTFFLLYISQSSRNTQTGYMWQGEEGKNCEKPLPFKQ